MIPKEKIEEVRDRASIVQVISEYIPLKKRGHNYLGLCPFHSEKSPSFTVNEEKKIFYCFGCNATGNVVTFVMKKEGMAFPDALRALARKFGVNLEEEKRTPTRKDWVLYALKSACDYYMKELKSPEAKVAREYLEKRGFEGEIVNRFQMGFAPEIWDGLTGFLRKKNVSMEIAEAAGLAVKRQSGTGCYDRFRGRIMFPIMDVKGRVIGFGGRGLTDKVQPKYLNSPESEVFKKGDVLFGLSQARQKMLDTQSVIVVEGYFDLLALHSHGFTNTVATMGTALTPSHIRTLKGYAETVYALFDSDEAGKSAAIRSLPLFLDEDMHCRAVLLPNGKDPDEFLKNSGPQAMTEAIERSEYLMDFYLIELGRKTGTSSPQQKKKFFESALKYLQMVKNVAEKGHYSGLVASMLNISAESVYEALKTPEKPVPAAVPGSSAGLKGPSLKELTILRVILKHPNLFEPGVGEAIKSFRDPALKSAGLAISGFLSSGKDLDHSALLEEIKDEAIKARVAELLFKDEEGFIEGPEKMLEDCLKRVAQGGKIKEHTREMIKRLEETGLDEVAREIRKRVKAEEAH